MHVGPKSDKDVPTHPQEGTAKIWIEGRENSSLGPIIPLSNEAHRLEGQGGCPSPLPFIHPSAWKENSQKLAWGTREEDHIPCWANAVDTLDSFRTIDEGIAPWGEEGLT